MNNRRQPSNRPGKGRSKQTRQADPWFHLLDLYARLVSSRAPNDNEIAHFLRLRPALKPAEIGWLLGHVQPMLRRRIRTLQLYRWAGEQAPLIGDDWREIRFPGLEEAAFALYRHLREELQSTPLQSREIVMGALDEHARWTPSPRVRLFEEKGDPVVRLRDFQTRFESDPKLNNAGPVDQISAEWSLPGDLAGRWIEQFGREKAAALATACLAEPTTDLRVNVHRISRDEALRTLAKADVDAAPTALSPHGIRLAARQRVHGLDLHRDGLLEMQDEGSQLVALAVDPRPGWKVLDACAGAGGKTLHLAALMKGRGEVHAHDRDERKLEDLKLRARRAQASNVRIVQPGAIAANDYHVVLIDAPCLGLGTLRRNPDITWRGPLSDRLPEMVTRQQECVREYAQFIRPDGFLVYTTCSFEPEETSQLLERCLSAVFEPAPIQPCMSHWQVPLEVSGHQLTLLPSDHGTDGFFIARYRRKG